MKNKIALSLFAIGLFGTAAIKASQPQEDPPPYEETANLSIAQLTQQGDAPTVKYAHTKNDRRDKIVYFSSKNLSSLEGLSAVPEIEDATELMLDKNRIVQCPEHIFDRFGSLRCLDLSNNRLTSLAPRVFDPLAHSLQVLKLQNNQLASAMPAIDSLAELCLLQLSGNQLTEFPETRLVHLQYLDLRNNKITTFCARFLCSLELLFLTANQTHHLSAQEFDYSPRLRQIHIENNPLDKEEFKDFKNKMAQKHPNISIHDKKTD
jgi:hypothetical protein